MSHTMLYRHPGPHAIHGGSFDYLIVPDADVDATLADGWHRTTTEALKADEEAKPVRQDDEDDGAPVGSTKLDRDALEAEAKKLGVQFGPRLSDKKLAERIAEATAAQAATKTEPAAD